MWIWTTYVHVKFVDFGEDPSDRSVAAANQDPERIEMAKQPQPVCIRIQFRKREREDRVSLKTSLRRAGWLSWWKFWADYLPESRSAVHQIENLGRIEKLLEASQKLDALIVARFRIDEDQERRTSLRPDSFPRLIRSFFFAKKSCQKLNFSYRIESNTVKINKNRFQEEICTS